MYAPILFCWIIVCTRRLSRINIERHISYLSLMYYYYSKHFHCVKRHISLQFEFGSTVHHNSQVEEWEAHVVSARDGDVKVRETYLD